MKKTCYVLVMILVTLLFGCKPIKKLVNKSLPPLSVLDQQMQAVSQNMNQLDSVDPSIGLFVRADMIKEFLPPQIKKAALISPLKDMKLKSIEPTVSLVNQALRVDATFSLDLTKHEINIQGHLRGLTALSTKQDSLILQSAFQSIEVEEISFLNKKPRLKNRAIAKLIRPLLKHFLENMNRSSFKKPSAIFMGWSTGLELDSGTVFSNKETEIVNYSKKKTERFVSSSAFLLNPTGIYVLIDLDDKAREERTAPVNYVNSPISEKVFNQAFNDYSEKYMKRWMQEFDQIEDSTRLAVMIAKKELASILNQTLAGTIQIKQKITIPKSSSTSKLEVTQAKIDCEKLRGKFSYPKFKGAKCNWSCMKTVRIGLIKIKTNDPACVASRKLCVGKRETERIAWQTGKELAHARHKLENEAFVAACNAARELNNFMNLGKAKVRFSGAGSANITLSAIRFNNDLSNMSFNQRGNVHLKTDSRISLRPQDLGYAFMCIMDYDKDLKSTARAVFPSQTISIDFNALHKGDNLVLVGTPNKIKYRAKVSPAPAVDLISDPKLAAKCNYLHTVIGLASVSSFTNLVKYDPQTELFLKGTAQGDYAIPAFTQTIEPIIFQLDAKNLRSATPVWNKKNIAFIY